MKKIYKINMNGKSYEIVVEEISVVDSAPVSQTVVSTPTPVQAPTPVVSAAGTKVEAPMPGVIVDVKVKVGDTVKEGDLIAVIEAMKMETDLISTVTGVVTSVVAKGTQVNAGDAVITL